MIKVSDYLIKYLQDKGIKRIYGLSGGMIMHIMDSIKNSDIEFIPMLHEQGMSISAEAESIYNNSPAVVLTTAGPGITNAITAIASAWIDGNPLLILSGQCKTADSMQGTKLRQKGIQEVSAVDILKPITKYSQSINNYRFLRLELERAFNAKLSDRKGPVFLEIPLDIQSQEIDENELTKYFGVDKAIFDDFDDFDDKIDNLIELLDSSERPVILAGNGIRQSGALEQFKELCDYLGIPILLTWKSKDFFADDYQYNFGMPGSISSRYANKILQECDLLISIGAKIDLLTCAFDYSNFAKNAKKVVVDVDNAEIDKLEFGKEIIFNCGAKIFIEKILNKQDRIRNNLNYLDWIITCRALKESYPICLPEYYKEKNYVNPYVFTKELSNQCKGDDIIVAASSGSASEIMAQAFEIKEGQRFISSNGLGAMGFGICHAIGCAFASDKKKRVICVEGDGSFFMNVQHLQTIAQYRLPIIIFVWENGEYKSIRDTHMKFFDRKIGCDKESGLELPDIEQIAKSYGIDYFKLIDNGDVEPNLNYILDSVYMEKKYNPIICEVKVDPNFPTQPKVQSYVDEQGNMQSGKLENMWPFIKDEK